MPHVEILGVRRNRAGRLLVQRIGGRCRASRYTWKCSGVTTGRRGTGHLEAPSLPDDQPVIQYLISDGIGSLISAPSGRSRATFPQPLTGVVYEIFFRTETTKGMGDPSEFIAVIGRTGPALVPDQPFVEVVWPRRTTMAEV